MKLLLERGYDWGYLPEPAKSLFILDLPAQEEVLKWDFRSEDIQLKFLSGSRYLGEYLGPKEELEA